jgi:hypothetical protein
MVQKLAMMTEDFFFRVSSRKVLEITFNQSTTPVFLFPIH